MSIKFSSQALHEEMLSILINVPSEVVEALYLLMCNKVNSKDRPHRLLLFEKILNNMEKVLYGPVHNMTDSVYVSAPARRKGVRLTVGLPKSLHCFIRSGTKPSCPSQLRLSRHQIIADPGTIWSGWLDRAPMSARVARINESLTENSEDLLLLEIGVSNAILSTPTLLKCFNEAAKKRGLLPTDMCGPPVLKVLVLLRLVKPLVHPFLKLLLVNERLCYDLRGFLRFPQPELFLENELCVIDVLLQVFRHVVLLEDILCFSCDTLTLDHVVLVRRRKQVALTHTMLGSESLQLSSRYEARLLEMPRGSYDFKRFFISTYDSAPASPHAAKHNLNITPARACSSLELFITTLVEELSGFSLPRIPPHNVTRSLLRKMMDGPWNRSKCGGMELGVEEQRKWWSAESVWRRTVAQCRVIDGPHPDHLFK